MSQRVAGVLLIAVILVVIWEFWSTRPLSFWLAGVLLLVTALLVCKKQLETRKGKSPTSRFLSALVDSSTGFLGVVAAALGLLLVAFAVFNLLGPSVDSSIDRSWGNYGRLLHSYKLITQGRDWVQSQFGTVTSRAALALLFGFTIVSTFYSQSQFGKNRGSGRAILKLVLVFTFLSSLLFFFVKTVNDRQESWLLDSDTHQLLHTELDELDWYQKVTMADALIERRLLNLPKRTRADWSELIRADNRSETSTNMMRPGIVVRWEAQHVLGEDRYIQKCISELKAPIENTLLLEALEKTRKWQQSTDGRELPTFDELLVVHSAFGRDILSGGLGSIEERDRRDVAVVLTSQAAGMNQDDFPLFYLGNLVRIVDEDIAVRKYSAYGLESFVAAKQWAAGCLIPDGESLKLQVPLVGSVDAPVAKVVQEVGEYLKEHPEDIPKTFSERDPLGAPF